MKEPLIIQSAQPLTLRYLLHVHGPLNVDRANKLAAEFEKRAPFQLVKRPTKHREFGVKRKL